MPRYRFTGDSPRSLPEYGIEVVSPGETVETVQELNHPDFKLLIEKVKTSEKAEKSVDKGEKTVAAVDDKPAESKAVSSSA